MGNGESFVDVAIDIPVDRLFTYRVPKALKNSVEIGKRVSVPFRNRNCIGYIEGTSQKRDIKGMKSINAILDDKPVISDQLMKLTKWISETYLSSWGQAIHAAVPAVIKSGKASMASRGSDSVSRNISVKRDRKHVLTGEQEIVLQSVLHKIESESYRAFLLYGITASGKTEVYLQAIEKVLKKGKASVVLVPEIALTPQTVERFTSRFGELVAVVHSQLLGSMRYREWKRIRDGEAKIVVGARSAIFSPVANLGLIIVDEEHETSYKQEDAPRYHARDVALMRARLANCPVILGSATPSLESFFLAKKNKLELIQLTKRIDDRDMPKVKIIDMRAELTTRKKLTMFSRVLIDSIDRTLKKGQQAIIFLNRRGFSTYVNCKKCGNVLKCKKCTSVLVYHFQSKELVCHYCNYRIAPPDICPNCNSSYMKYFGIGTEKVESEVARLFPGARIARMDTDTMSKRGSHERVLGEFKRHEIDILVGTQMIAKGLDFPRVTLVGVINADVTLNIPDFRSSERTFSLLTQVAGRAGRGDEGGEVIVQTYAPDHYAITSASKHDYEKFYKDEISSRKELYFPPFRHIIKLTLRSRNEKKASDSAKTLKNFLIKKLKDIECIGPAPSRIPKIRGYFRWNILLKGKNRSIMSHDLKKSLVRYRKPGGTIITIDVDPISV